MKNDTLTTLIESSDLDGLVRYVDGLVVARDWNGIEVMRDRCREAVERGKQVWGPAEYAEYRMALEGPADRAVAVLGDGKGRYCASYEFKAAEDCVLLVTENFNQAPQC